MLTLDNPLKLVSSRLLIALCLSLVQATVPLLGAATRRARCGWAFAEAHGMGANLFSTWFLMPGLTPVFRLDESAGFMWPVIPKLDAALVNYKFTAVWGSH